MNSDLQQKTDNIPLLANLPTTKLNESGIPDLVDLCLYGRPNTFRTLKKFVRSYADPLGTWANNDSVRRAMDRAYKANGVDGFLGYITKNGPLSSSSKNQVERESATWNRFRLEATDYREQYPDSNLSQYCEFILTKADVELNDVETLMWCAIACLQGVLTMEGFPLGIAKDAFIGRMVPIDLWIPEANDKGQLSTSRYRVMNHMLRSYMRNKNSTAMQHLRGGVQWRKPNDQHELRKLCRIKAKLALYDVPYRTSLDLPLDVQFHFLEVFEWLQLSLFNDGVSASEIVNEFSKFPKMHAVFYKELFYFYKKKESRRIYNHYV